MKKWFIKLLKKMKFNINLFSDELGNQKKTNKADVWRTEWDLFIESLIHDNSSVPILPTSKISREDEEGFYKAWNMVVSKLNDEEVNTLLDQISEAWNTEFPIPHVGASGTLDNLLKIRPSLKATLLQAQMPNQYFDSGMHLMNNSGPQIVDGSNWLLKITPFTQVKVKLVSEDSVFFYNITKDANEKSVITDSVLSLTEFRSQYRKGSFRDRERKAPVSRVVTGEEVEDRQADREAIEKLIAYVKGLKEIEDLKENK
jgi:hypothetical protein